MQYELADDCISVAGAKNLGREGFGAVGCRFAEYIVRWLMWPFNTVQDAAKTPIYLAASEKIKEKGASRQYWVPVWSWTNRYVRCQPEELKKSRKGH